MTQNTKEPDQGYTPRTAEEWCEEAFYISDIFAKPIREIVTKIIRRAQEQARQDAIEECLAVSAGCLTGKCCGENIRALLEDKSVMAKVSIPHDGTGTI